MNSKIQRINAELQRQISYIVNYGMKDPRVNGLISVTKVNTAGDLKTAKVYVSFLETADKTETMKTLKNATGFIRNELKDKMEIRYMPELIFIMDDSIEYGIRMTKLIEEVAKKDAGE